MWFAAHCVNVIIVFASISVSVFRAWVGVFPAIYDTAETADAPMT